jgi:hypothetical protein
VSGVEPPRPSRDAPARGTAPAPAALRIADAPPALNAMPSGTTLTATVLGRDGAGHLMLRSPHGLLVLATGQHPPNGAEVTLQLRTAGTQLQAYILSVRVPGGSAGPAQMPAAGAGAATAAPGAGAAAAGGVAAAPALTRSWPALEAALAAVQRPGLGTGSGGASDLAAAIASAGNPLARAIPRPGPGFAGGLLVLMAALGRGDLSAWLGGAPLQALQRSGRDDLVQRLQGDFRHLSALAEDAGEERRLFALPLLGDDGVRPARLFLGHGGAAAEAGGPVRFTVELDLPRLGELQLDGLARAGRLDLILRSRFELPEALAAELRRAALDALASVGWTGELRLQSGAAWTALPVRPDDPAAHAGLTA